MTRENGPSIRIGLAKAAEIWHIQLNPQIHGARIAMIGHLNGVIIWTGDLPRLREFYCGKLGMTPHSDRPYFVSFKWGGLRFAIGSHDHVSGQARDPYRVMVNFDVDGIHDLHESLVAAGVEFIRPPEKEHWGGWVASFKDPDGNIVQLLEQPPGRKGQSIP